MQKEPNYFYAIGGSRCSFDKGIHIVATNQDPTEIRSNYRNVDEYWKMLAEHETTSATDSKFISIILVRGEKPTGQFGIKVESFEWLESIPIKLNFQVNFVDPPGGYGITEQATIPLVIIPIGKLAPGEYHIQVNITRWSGIAHIDYYGNSFCDPRVKLAQFEWKQTLTIQQ